MFFPLSLKVTVFLFSSTFLSYSLPCTRHTVSPAFRFRRETVYLVFILHLPEYIFLYSKFKKNSGFFCNNFKWVFKRLTYCSHLAVLILNMFALVWMKPTVQTKKARWARKASLYLNLTLKNFCKWAGNRLLGLQN